MRILVVEDEKKLAQFIHKGLTQKGYDVDVVHHGDEGFKLAIERLYEVIILDIMLPGKDGIFICRELRKKNVNVPVLMLSARDEIEDKVSGLDSGADDYLTKPFQFAELLARVKALIRRRQDAANTRLRVADLELDQLTHTVRRAGREIQLTGTEYDLLEYLMMKSNQVVTRTMINEHVWRDDYDSLSNLINVYVNHLRKKVDTGFSKRLIHSIRGIGYILKDDADQV
jgi:DNA-binding response OmpR family regulator